MTVYTYYGNKDERTDGTSVLTLDSGRVPIGHWGDFTNSEYNLYSQFYILKVGIVPWNRTDFPWQIDEIGYLLGQSSESGSGNVGFPSVIQGGDAATPIFISIIFGGNASTPSFLQTIDGGNSGSGSVNALPSTVSGGDASTSSFTSVISGGNASSPSSVQIFDGGNA